MARKKIVKKKLGRPAGSKNKKKVVKNKTKISSEDSEKISRLRAEAEELAITVMNQSFIISRQKLDIFKLRKLLISSWNSDCEPSDCEPCLEDDLIDIEY